MSGPSYYPSARVRLLLRLEDYGAPNTPAPPKRPVINRRGTKDTGQALTVVMQDGIFVLTGPGGHPGERTGPHDQTTSADGLTHVVDGIVPTDATLDRNGIRVADQLKVTINYTDLPIDPRVIRACGVEYFSGVIPADEWERGVRGELRPSATAQGLALPYNLIPDSFIDSQGRTRSNLRFQGWADEIAFGLPKDGGSTMEFDCTDNTRLLIDIDAPPALTIDPAIRVDQAIANYLAAFPALRGIGVQYVPPVDAAQIPKLKDSLTRNAFPPKLGPTPQGKLAVWDYLTDVAGTIGHTIRMEGLTIIIQRAKTLYVNGFNGRADDPFQGRQLPDGTLLPNRTYVYGDNMLEFEMRRKFTRSTPTNIEVRCLPGDVLVAASNIERAYRRIYSGPMVRVLASNDRHFTGTPNHPMLTRRGWVPLHALVEGDDLICSAFGEGMKPFGYPDVDRAPTPIGEVFDSLALASAPQGRAGRDVDFHGDGMDGQVDVVSVDRELPNRGKPSFHQHAEQLDLVFSGDPHAVLQSDGAPQHGSLDLGPRSPESSASREHRLGSSILLHPAHLEVSVPGCVGEGAQSDPSRAQCLKDNPVVDAERLAELVCAGSVEVTTAKVVSIERVNDFSGHVYNLQTAASYYTACGFISHNSYLPDRAKTLVVRYPEKIDRKKKLMPGDNADQKYTVIRVSGIGDKATMRVIAQTYYESIGRKEIEATVLTRNLSSFGGDEIDPDIFDALSGDNVDIYTAPPGDEQSVNTVQVDALQSAAAQRLITLGFNPDFAAAYATSYGSIGFPHTFKVRNSSQTWGNDSGIDIQIAVINYVEVRADADLPAGEEVATDAASLSRSPEIVTIEDDPQP